MGDCHICQPCQQGILQDYKSKLEQLRSALSGVAVYHDKIDQTELYDILKTIDITIMPDTIQLLQAIFYNNRSPWIIPYDALGQRVKSFRDQGAYFTRDIIV